MRSLNRMVHTGLVAVLMVVLMGSALHATELKVALNADIRSSNPGVNRDANTDTVMLQIVEGLVGHREDGTVGPLLAEKIDVSDDGRIYTFTLREGVKFHNGEMLTSEHVIWSWKRYMDPETKWRCYKYFSGQKAIKIESFEAVDSRTVRFVLKEPSAMFLVSMARTDCGMGGILHPSSVAADGSWINPVGTGPFKLESWKKGEGITLAKFENYTSLPGSRNGYVGGKTAGVDKVEIMVIPDSAAANAALLAGEIQIIPNLPTASRAELTGKKNVVISHSPTFALAGMLLQTRDPLIGKLEMRQAIVAALDMKQMVAAITEGLAEPNSSVVPSSSVYHTAVHNQGYTYDPAKAKALLKKAGYKGEPVEILTNKRYESMYKTAIFAQAMLQAAGINAKLEVMEWGTQLDRYKSGKYQIMAFSYSARMDPALGYDSISGDKDNTPKKVWDDAEGRTLIAEALKSSDRAKRQELFDKLHRMMIAEIPIIVMYNSPQVAATSKDVKGYAPWPISRPRFYGVTLDK